MKTLIKTLFLICLIAVCGVTGYASETTITNSGNKLASYTNADILNGKVVVIGEAGYVEGIYKPLRALLNDGGWREISKNISSHLQDTALIGTLSSEVRFDSTGAIWVGGIALYKYEIQKDAWTKYFIDDKYNKSRRYEKICVDKFNNKWIAASIYNKDSAWNYSELLKFDGAGFTTILRFETSVSFINSSVVSVNKTIAALPDGRICVQRVFGDAHVEEPEKHWEDIYFINQDGSYERVKALTPSGKNFDDYNKDVAFIYPETASKVWFCFTESIYYTQQDLMKTCCSGLSVYDEGEWTAFNENNGLDIIHEDTYRDIFRIAKIDHDKYLVLGLRRLFIMDQKYHLNSLNYEEILKTSSFEVANDYFNGENGFEYLRKLYDDLKPYTPKIVLVSLEKNGQVTIVLDKGILRFPMSLITSATEPSSSDIATEVFPNPASGIIKIRRGKAILGWEIFDAMGRKALQGANKNNEVNLEALSQGAYFLRLIDDKQTSEVISFIKN